MARGDGDIDKAPQATNLFKHTHDGNHIFKAIQMNAWRQCHLRLPSLTHSFLKPCIFLGSYLQPEIMIVF